MEPRHRRAVLLIAVGCSSATACLHRIPLPSEPGGGDAGVCAAIPGRVGCPCGAGCAPGSACVGGVCFSDPGDIAFSDGGDAAMGVDITSNLIGHWKMDETSGTTIIDFAGGDNNGTLVGGSTIVAAADSVLGGAIALDGNIYFDLAGTGNAKPLVQITVAAWVKANTSGEMSFLRSAQSDGWSSGWRLVTDVSQDFTFRVTTDAPAPANTATALSLSSERLVAGQWQHVVGVYDGTNVLLYLDGRLLDSASLTGNISYPTPGEGNSLLGISNGVPGMDGAMDEVRIYDRALNAEEVMALCNLVPADIASGLELRWKLDETAGDALDSSGNGYTGLTTGAGWMPTGGIIDGALDHDDVADNVTLNSAPILDNLSDSITVALWVKRSGIIADAFASPIWKSDFANGGWAFNRNNATNDLQFRIDTSGGNNQVACCLAGVFDGAWHHIAMILDGGVIRAYKDGTLEIDSTYVHGAGFGTTASLSMDADHVTRDDVRIYGRVLSAFEINALPGL